MSKQTIDIQHAFEKAADFGYKPLFKADNFKQNVIYKLSNFRQSATEFGISILCTVDWEYNYFLPKRFNNLINSDDYNLVLHDETVIYVEVKEFKKFKNRITPIFKIVKNDKIDLK